MPGGRKGVKFGVERVEAISGPLDGQLISGQVASTLAAQWRRFATAETRIEGVVVKAMDGNAGKVYVTGVGGPAAGYELGAGQSVEHGN